MNMCTFSRTIGAGLCALLAITSGCGKNEIGSTAGGVQPETVTANNTNGAARIPVTKEQVTRFGIMIAPAITGTVVRSLQAPGEIKTDADRVARVVPLAPGIVRQVTKTIGDRVQAGEILAWIESAELAAAKLDYYAKVFEARRCELRVPQAKAIFENTSRLIALLKDGAGDEALGKLDGLEMGAYRGQLLTAYAAYRAAGKIHARETGLRASAVNSEQDLLLAETALMQARATFHAMLNTARFEVLMAYTEALKEHQTDDFDATAAETRLRQSGADDEVVAGLRALVPEVGYLPACLSEDSTGAEGGAHSVKKALGANERFAWYALQAPLEGTVVERRIALGESLETTAEVFTVADLARVWVDLALNQDSMSDVRVGYPMTIRLSDGTTRETTVQHVSPVVDPQTRTVTVRAVLSNDGGLLRPGTFIEAAIQIPSDRQAVLVPTDAVQLVYDHACIFVWGDGAFELREVQTGTTDGIQVEILRGLQAGERVAAVNAFHLKAELIKSAAGDMGAGHGHSH
ncbi:MAG: efflux RND transporter periplasmic adaptor subunit [Lentisphaerae bacterium]|nr:efflux RND transporter periplasmic adaptor subunit [Lentisphaerota bacterium]